MNAALLFTLRRLEDTSGTASDLATAKTWEETDKILRQWANTINNGKVNEVMFSILFDNSNVYKGRLSLTSQNANDRGLMARCVGRDLAFRAGLCCPIEMTEDEYRTRLAEMGVETQLLALNWLRNYLIPDEE
jgi:flagellar capping protein FliD